MPVTGLLRVSFSCGTAAIAVTAALASFPAPAGAQTFTEPANYGDHTLSGPGASQEIEVYAGGSIDASTLGGNCVGLISDAPDVQLELVSSEETLRISAATQEDVDLTLVVNTATGDWTCDDDSGDLLNPLVSIDDPVAGTYDIWVGALDSDQFSRAILTVSQDGAGVVADLVSTPTGVERMEGGELAAGDAVVDDKFADSFSVEGTEGEELVLDLRSSEFDTYLTVTSPSGEIFSNDDYQGAVDRSVLALTLAESGNYDVSVSSFYTDETGAYTLAISRPTTTAPQEITEESGTLAAGDATRDDGMYVDTFEFEGAPGRRAVIDLTSDAFDTYLVLTSPSGSVLENDDMDTIGHSQIDTELSETGTYRVQVTSYATGETGSYRLVIDPLEAISTAEQADRDTVELAFGQAAEGRLENSDMEVQADQYQDIYSFAGEAGQNVRVDMSSDEFDTYLTVRTPDGSDYSNDDFDGSTARSVVEFTLPVSGRYQILATSYGTGMTGTYDLSADLVTSVPADAIAEAVGDGGTIYGIFAGISDYSQLREIDAGWGDLDYTADDAVVTRDALIANAGLREENAYTFLDGEATLANIEAAFGEIASRIGPDDRFIFFFSGHGGQEERADGHNALDADGFDETLALSDRTVTDDEIALLFDRIGAGTSVVILDSCYSGGFAKDIVSAPGRMGLFSSDEDVPSLVADKFEAGGYLSFFFKEAVEDGRADDNGDSSIDAIELSQYLQIRYNEEAMAKAQSRFETPHFGYQHLVVDRGGVSHDTVLFTVN